MRLLLILSILQLNGVAQEPLQFAELGFEPSHCRTQPYQSGNGVVYASAKGGQPDYTYLLYDHTSQTYVFNNLWGGLNPGLYTIKVFDSAGDSIQSTLFLDSLDHEAKFEILSNQLIDMGGTLVGQVPAYLELQNQSLPFAMADPFPWTQNPYRFKWKLGNTPWSDSLTFNDSYQQFIGLTTAQQTEICLRYENKNGCVDTSCTTIHLVNPPNSTTPSNYLTIISGNQQLNCVNQHSSAIVLAIYTQEGLFVQEEILHPGMNTISFFSASGNYIAHLSDSVNGAELESFHFHF